MSKGDSPLKQFEIKPLVDLELFGIDISFTNSSLWMVITTILILAFSAIFEQFFQLEEHNSDVVTELRDEVVTFFTSSYIIFVQPAVLSNTGMDFGAVMTATCLASAIWCLIMGLWANYPIVLTLGYSAGVYILSTNLTIFR